MGSVKSPVGCLVCLNSTENILIPAEQSKNIFNVCYLYVKDSINIEVLVKNINHNKNKLSFCKNCLDSSVNLSQLVDKLSILKKEIADFTNSFSKTIAKQRCQAATANKNKKQFTNNYTFHGAIQQNANNSSDDPLNDSSNTSIDDHNLYGVDFIKSEIVKIESNDVFLDSEEGNVSNEYEANYTETENQNEFDPFEEIDFQPTYESPQIPSNNEDNFLQHPEQNSNPGNNVNPMAVATEDPDPEMVNQHPEICNPFNIEKNIQSSIKKKERKRIRKPKKPNSSRLRMEGKEYFGLEKTTQICDGNLKTMPKAVIRKAREMGPTCCSKLCEKAKNRRCSDFTEKNRDVIFQAFWKNMDWAQKRVFVTSLIAKEKPKHVSGGINSRRAYSFQYYLKIGDLKKQVCKQMFLSTLGLRKNQLHDWIKSTVDQH